MRRAALLGLGFQNPPRDRARVARERIRAALAHGRDLTVSFREDTAGRLLTIGGRGAFVFERFAWPRPWGEQLGTWLLATSQRLGLFPTRIRTNKREIVTIPNAVLAGQLTKNYTQSQEKDAVIVGTGITIGYDTPWRQVEGLLLLAAERTPGIRKGPAPWVNQRSLGDFYVDYELCAALEDATRRVRTLTALHANILDAFNEYGVQITSPNYEADPADAKVVPRERWFAAPARRRPEGEPTGG